MGDFVTDRLVLHPLTAPEAEAFVAESFTEHGLWESAAALPDGTAKRFGELSGD